METQRPNGSPESSRPSFTTTRSVQLAERTETPAGMLAEFPTWPHLVVSPKTTSPAGRSIEKRRIRKHQLLNVIREHGPLSRADIAKISGYNLPSVSSLVDELVSDGIVVEEEARPTSRGRRPIPVLLNHKAAVVIGIDLGTKTTIGVLMNLGGDVLVRIERPTPSFRTPDGKADDVVKFAMDLLSQCPQPLAPLAGVGVGISGLIGTRRSEQENSVIFEEQFQSLLAERLGVPALVKNDSQMLSLGSLWFGSGAGYETFAILNIAEGLGLGFVINRRVYRGAMGFAGDIGHTPMGDSGIPCYCGNTGCTENVASGNGLLRLAKQEGLEGIEQHELEEMFHAGDERARRIFRRFTEVLGRAVATVVHLYNPEVVILAGRCAPDSSIYFDQLKHEAALHMRPSLAHSTEFFPCKLREDAVPRGSAASVLHHIFSSAHVDLEQVL